MSRTDRRVALGVALLAVLIRAAAVLVLEGHRVPRSTYEHGEIAANLLAGRGFSIRFLGAEGPTSQQAPLYPLLVAACYAVGGVEAPGSLLLLELVQAALGGLMVLGAMWLARQAAPRCPPAAWAAGLVAAVHPTLVYAATHVQVASLAATLLVWTLAWGAIAAGSGRAGHAAVTGVLLTALALTDPILSLAGIGVVGAIAAGSRSSPSPCRSRLPAPWLIGIILGTATLGITPWLVRNALVHGEFVAIKSTFGYAFWQGNCALSEGTDKVVRRSVEEVLFRGEGGEGLAGLNRTLWAARHEAGYIDDIALSREDIKKLGSVSEPERSRVLFRRAMGELAAEPGRYARLCLRRFRSFWLFDETNPKARVLVYRIGHLGLTALAIAGIALARGDVRARLGPTFATAAAVSLFHTLTIVSARFHVPIEPLMAVWAGAGLTRWGSRDVGLSAAARHHVVGVGLHRHLGRRVGLADLR
jgi:hypothetical protein